MKQMPQMRNLNCVQATEIELKNSLRSICMVDNVYLIVDDELSREIFFEMLWAAGIIHDIRVEGNEYL